MGKDWYRKAGFSSKEEAREVGVRSKKQATEYARNKENGAIQRQSGQTNRRAISTISRPDLERGFSLEDITRLNEKFPFVKFEPGAQLSEGFFKLVSSAKVPVEHGLPARVNQLNEAPKATIETVRPEVSIRVRNIILEIALPAVIIASLPLTLIAMGLHELSVARQFAEYLNDNNIGAEVKGTDHGGKIFITIDGQTNPVEYDIETLLEVAEIIARQQ